MTKCSLMVENLAAMCSKRRRMNRKNDETRAERWPRNSTSWAKHCGLLFNASCSFVTALCAIHAQYTGHKKNEAMQKERKTKKR